MRVLVAAAHPDDEWLGVGGTILRHVANGDEVTVYIDGLCRQPDWTRPQTLANRAGFVLTTDFPTAVPDILYTHHTGDLNADHRDIAERALVLGRFAQTVRTFETVSSTEWGLTPFNPDYYVNIDIRAKLDHLVIYDGEMRDYPHPRSYQGVEALAQGRGMTVGMTAAEAFVTIRDTW